MSTLTVLGSSSSIPRPGRACSCYLIQNAGQAIAFDMGSGAFANLRGHLPAEALTAVVISHMHPDHFLDLVPLRYALKYGPRTNGARPIVLLPPGGEAVLRGMAAAFAPESESDYLAEVYDIRTYDPNVPLTVGAATLHFSATTHFIPTYAVRYEHAGTSVTYSADTAPSPGVAQLARDSDVFVCEATLLPGEIEPRGRGHMSAREAGALARDAAARKLVLTHYSAEATPAQLLAEARSAFPGDVVVADDELQLAVG